MTVTASMVKELREKTGAGVLDCRNALVEAEGDFEKAEEQLRQKGMAEAAKRKDRETKEGIIASYVHAGDRNRDLGRVELRDRFRLCHGRVPQSGQGADDAGGCDEPSVCCARRRS